ncbi:glutamate racemase [Formosa sp. 3Alg 14/1]|uniref:glutamate racemase n=1 Tax=Formosa sp. 3Alg 14/1 TaxID=3382190 RepID=UPI0039BEAECA
MSKQPIGIFDSGVGGTSVFKEIEALLPNENTIYLADSANAPYGDKSAEDILKLSIKNTELLLSKNCKLIVVACNTATTNAITTLRASYNVPFIGIEPAIKPASLNSKTKAVGILATKGTLSSELFHNTTNLYKNDVQVIEQIGEGIVPLIEAGKTLSRDMRALLTTYLKPMIDANIDYLVLGCTHYPYLLPLLLDILPNHVKIIDSGEAVARQTKTILETQHIINTQPKPASHKFYTNGNTEVMHFLLNNKYAVEYLRF